MCLQVNGTCVLADGPLPCFWRAPTDNDKGGSVLSYLSQWKASGLDTLTHTGCEGFSMQRTSDTTLLVKAVIFIEPRGSEPPPPEVSESQTGDIASATAEATKAHLAKAQREPPHRFTIEIQYNVFGDGNVLVSYDVDASAARISTLPRVGVQFTVDKGLREVQWYGRGPFECYPDRKSAARVGNFRKDVEELHVPYIVPGESGGRADVRWVAFTSKTEGVGIVAIRGDNSPPMQMSASFYSTHELDRATHEEDLQPGENIEVFMAPPTLNHSL